MRKLVSMFLMIMIVFSALSVGAAAVPGFMTETYNNYTADYKVSMSIENADEIVVLGKNGIIEKGSHDELMKLNKVYANMYNASLAVSL